MNMKFSLTGYAALNNYIQGKSDTLIINKPYIYHGNSRVSVMSNVVRIYQRVDNYFG
jgi:hypothetical protein